jgi:hypothetical protein
MPHAAPDFGPQTKSQALGTSASIAAHLIMLGLVMFSLAQAPGHSPTAIAPTEQFNLAFFKRPGPVGGGGGGPVAAPARPAQIPVPRTPEITPVVSPADVPQDPVPNIPVTAIQPVKLLPGGLTEIDAQNPGHGAGPGGGAGRGPGSGPGDGPGSGPGPGGPGGDVFDAGGGVTAPLCFAKSGPPTP